MRNKTAIGYAMLAIIVIIWGMTFISTKVLLRHLAPVDVLFCRFLIGYAALWAIHPRRAKFTTLKNEALIFAAGASGVLLYFLCENIALKHTLASNVGPLVSTTPVLTLLLSAWVNRDGSITRATVLGCVAGLAGVVLVFRNGAVVFEVSPLGDALALGAALCWAVYCVLLKRITSIGNTIALTRRIFGYGLVAMIPMLCVTGLHARAGTFAQASVIGNLLFLGLGASALCYVLWNASVGLVGVAKAAYFLYFVPVVTLVAAAVVLDEKITPYAIGGAALIIAGVWIAEPAEPAAARREIPNPEIPNPKKIPNPK